MGSFYNKIYKRIGIVFIILIFILITYIIISLPKTLHNRECSITVKEPMLLNPVEITVDNNGMIYIIDDHFLSDGGVQVYNNEFEYQHTIDTNNSGSILLEIESNTNNLKVFYVRSQTYKTFDENGCVIFEEKTSETKNNWVNTVYTTENGVVYKINRKLLGDYSIEKIEGNQRSVIYNISNNDKLIKWSVYFLTTIFIIVVTSYSTLILINKYTQKKN